MEENKRKFCGILKPYFDKIPEVDLEDLFKEYTGKQIPKDASIHPLVAKYLYSHFLSMLYMYAFNVMLTDIDNQMLCGENKETVYAIKRLLGIMIVRYHNALDQYIEYVVEEYETLEDQRIAQHEAMCIVINILEPVLNMISIFVANDVYLKDSDILLMIADEFSTAYSEMIEMKKEMPDK